MLRSIRRYYSYLCEMLMVTGGTGFLGSHLICHLLGKGFSVRAIRRKTSVLSTFKRVSMFYDLPEKLITDKLTWAEADVLDLYSLENVLPGVTEIYHCAGMVSFQPGDGNKLQQININGTANLVNLSLERNIKKFCHVSSTAALGRSDRELLIDEKMVWKTSGRNSRYAVSKYGAEREVWRGIAEGLNAVIVNPSIIIGPGEVNSGSTRMIRVIDKGFKLYTPGSNGFVDVRDVAEIMIQLMEKNIFGERFIISAENVTYKKLFEYIARYLNKKPPSFPVNGLVSEIAWRYEYARHQLFNAKPLITKETARTSMMNYPYSNQKIKEKLNYDFISIEKCIEDSCLFYLQNKEMITANMQ